jgi:hypothetical protein
MKIERVKRFAGVVALSLGTAFGQPAQAAGFGGLDAEWWQWAFSIPFAVNPVIDATGEHCMVGQRGDLWFLAGSFAGTATRSCTIPEGKTILVPAINTAQFDSPNLCGQDGTSLSVRQLRESAAAFIDAAANLSVTVDGRRQRLHRLRSNVFEVTLPAANVYDGFGLTPCPAGVYSPAVADGWYAGIPPLSKGAHVMRITGTSGDFVVDVTYNLTVVPVND